MLDSVSEAAVIHNLKLTESALLLVIGLVLIARFFVDEIKQKKLNSFDYATLVASTLVASRGVLKLIMTTGMWLKAKHGGLWMPVVVLVIPVCTIIIQYVISRKT